MATDTDDERYSMDWRQDLSDAERIRDTALLASLDKISRIAVDLGDRLAKKNERIEELEAVCGEAYIVVGSLLTDLGLFETERGQQILDNLSQYKRLHKDVLPWPSKE